MISLCTFVKNEAHCISHMVESVRDHVQEIVVVDTGSSDDTVQICRDLGARIYGVGFTDFGSIRTLASHLAREPWVLMLDADETLSSPELLEHLIHEADLGSEYVDAYAFPRKRWLDLDMTQQTELDAYPDVQVRFYRNNPCYVWKRELHEFFSGASVSTVDEPIINHFHDVFKGPERLKERLELYKRLAAKAGVTVEGGNVL